MISVIICFRSQDFLKQLNINIHQTIGVDHEIIALDNSVRRQSIFQVYNEGSSRANYEILVYVHEDVVFRTQDWGKVLVNYFTTIPKIGCVGIAGALYKSKSPSAWWDVEENNKVSHLVQWNTKGEAVFESRGWDNQPWREVGVIDGVLMATSKASQLRFDETMPGFHCYDLNLSIEASRKQLKVIASNEILLEHLSYGNVNKDWVIATHVFHQKYKCFLPIDKTEKSLNSFLEKDNLVKFIKLAFKHQLKQISYYYWMRYFLLKPLSRQHYETLKLSFKK